MFSDFVSDDHNLPLCGAPSALCIAAGFVLWPVAAVCGGVGLGVSLSWECVRCAVYTCQCEHETRPGCCEVMGIRTSANYPLGKTPWDWQWIRLRPGLPCCCACLRLVTTVHEQSRFDVTQYAVAEYGPIHPPPIRM